MMDLGNIPVWRQVGYRPRLADMAAACGPCPLVIVGAGPVGLALALDLGRRGHPVLVLNALPFIAAGSRAICFSKRSLEIFDRLGIGDAVRDKGVRWERGKVFWRNEPEPVYEFDLLPVKDQRNPAFVNIQQYYVEGMLVDALARCESVELRWHHEVVGVVQHADHVELTVETPEGGYRVRAARVVACDGCRSAVRRLLGLDFEGRVFEDNFLIADVRFKEERPAERWFHFDPPWPGWSSLVHKQPDGVWRLDFQLGWGVDRQEAVKPGNVEPFVRGMLGEDVEFEFEWISVYRFQCRRMARFVHDRVIFAGDAAHLVSPFGARGCNGGLQDVDNLGWKLSRVLAGRSPPALLESYNDEAIITADENILNSTRSTDFMTPKTETARVFRDAVLELARDYAFARPFVNSGRLSQPVSYAGSALNSADAEAGAFAAGPAPGSPPVDAPVRSSRGDDWLLTHLGGDAFVVLCFSGTSPPLSAHSHAARVEALREALPDELRVIEVACHGEAAPLRLVDVRGLAHERYAAHQGAVYLVRPDQHIAGRWRIPDAGRLEAAWQRACGLGATTAGSSCH